MCFRLTVPISLKPIVGIFASAGSAGFGVFARTVTSDLPAGGVPVPFSTPTAFKSNHDVGGDFIVKVKDRFAVSMVTCTGVGVPTWMCAVLALNSLTKSCGRGERSQMTKGGSISPMCHVR